ncbi:UNVERIFIED_CONTAM: hypothetical protein FKN15_077870 [Acipenser sinensis]
MWGWQCTKSLESGGCDLSVAPVILNKLSQGNVRCKPSSLSSLCDFATNDQI